MNVAAVAFTPEGHLLVFNRNAQIEMVEYDASGTNVLRVFNPNIAVNPHALRIDRYGNGLWMSAGMEGMVFKPDSNDIGEAHQLAVSKDLKTVYVADSINARVLKMER
jgi:sugar lactone lactonase YvrE